MMKSYNQTPYCHSDPNVWGEESILAIFNTLGK